MRASLCAVAVTALATLAGAYKPESTNVTDALADVSRANLLAAADDGSLKRTLAMRNVSQECAPEDVAVRKEYSLLTNEEKLNYTNAVVCLMSAPSRIPAGEVPGAKSRYDDFVATHANQTQTIHVTGNFLTWHRAFLHAFETALRDECDYAGYVPYWNWGKSYLDPINSPYFDGSPYSQGGNGLYLEHDCIQILDNYDCIPPGVGGGCVTEGPYAGLVVNMSSPSPVWPGQPDAPAMQYDPRCLRRDISPWLTSKWQGESPHLTDLLTNPLYQTDIGAFQLHLQGEAEDRDWVDLHTAGHFAYVGDPSGDFYISPNDPMFWLHHGMVDRTWWTWQNQEGRIAERAFQIQGTRTMWNDPPSGNATIWDALDMGYVGGKSKVKDNVSSMGGPYCYVYDG